MRLVIDLNVEGNQISKCDQVIELPLNEIDAELRDNGNGNCLKKFTFTIVNPWITGGPGNKKLMLSLRPKEEQK